MTPSVRASAIALVLLVLAGTSVVDAQPLPAVHSVAFVVPVHEPKFEHLVRFLASNDEHLNAVDILPVFSSDDDLARFTSDFPVALHNASVRPLVYGGAPELLQIHPVFYKKFWAVHNLTNQYAFFALLDVEVEFVRHVDVELLFRRYYRDKPLFGGSVEALSVFVSINAGSMWRFNEGEQGQLRRKNKDNSLYFWFNQLPVLEAGAAAAYIEQRLPELLSPTTDNIARVKQGTSWNEFDAISYFYFAILKFDWALVDVGYLGGDAPSFAEAGIMSERLMRLTKPFWVKRGAWAGMRDGPVDDMFMVFHTDRP